MDLIKQASSLILSPQCVDEYFVNFNFFDVPCFKSTLSKCLGLGIILGSILVKLPQIMKIMKNKSGEGISLISVMLDLSAITIYSSYSFLKGFPFSAWGDSAFLGVQTAIIGFLVFWFSNQKSKSILFMTVYCVVSYILMSGLTPINTLWTMQGFNIPILLTGKLAQAYTNYKNGHTGQLSAVTVIMLFAGSVARIFTSIQETGDSMVIITYLASSSANAVILMQLMYYWNVDITKTKKQKSKKKKQ
ncbi:PREDICTED: mannose-P-dolichol utilization defect 1 protein homolog [Nicrophorus vespilloides]|uniref:Mannose-P-dolichol utilization defect 1 protein homolog n=1 Tax=Nicrophorus vespilloides TaxID=110193 RepID=A0ABM1MHL1_NICVS|nr:PREDICTED: mannose-P-dolichol utilization defect 1 protein homolog [Nicrophorus vespilloides]